MKKLLFIVSLLFVALLLAFSSYASEEGFEGRRTAVFILDRSDVENYVNGGRAAVDLLLRKSAPAWLEYSIRTENRDVVLEIGFDFNSFDAYSAKLSALTGKNETPYYSKGDGILFYEDLSPVTLLNFLEEQLLKYECLPEREFSLLVKPVKNEIEINGKTISGKGSLMSNPIEDCASLAELRIHTSFDGKNGYERTIEATPVRENNENTEEAGERLARQFSLCTAPGAEVTSGAGGGDTVVLVFKATGTGELMYHTARILGADCRITEVFEVADNGNFGVVLTEYIDTNSLLDKYEHFEYAISFPEDTPELKGMSGITPYDGAFSVYDVEDCSFYYEKAPSFDKAEITLDLSSLFGYKKTAVLSMKKETAELFDMQIRRALKNELVDGSELNIYDESGYRNYEIVYSSCSLSDVNEFFSSVLGFKQTTEVIRTWLPFGRDRIKGEEGVGVIAEIEAPKSINVRYILPGYSLAKESDFASGDYDAENKTLTLLHNNGGSVSVRFRAAEPFHIAAEVALLILAAVIFFAVRKKIKKKKKTEPKRS